MANLVSPGISISVVDETLGQSAPQGTVPFVVIATSQNKSTPDGQTVAPGTTQDTAGRLYTIASQRELVQTFGNPIFRNVGGTQLHGDPTNEYGLLAAYSYLGLANRCFVVRADIDLDQLQPSTIAPTSPAPNGTVWINSEETLYGLFKWSSSELTWKPQTIHYTFSGLPDDGIGVNGEYAIGNDSEDPFITYYIKVTGSWEELSTATDVQVGKVWPSLQSDGTTALANGNLWIKTSPSMAGTNFVLSVYDEAVNQYVLKDCPVLLSDSQANTHYSGVPSIGSFYLEAESSDAGVLLPKRYTGTAWELFTGYYFSDSEPSTGPSQDRLWYNPDVGLNGSGISTVDMLVNSGTNEWLNVRLPGIDYNTQTGANIGTRVNFYNGGSGEVRLILQPDNPVNTGFVLRNSDIWVETDALNTYPVIRKWKSSNSSWVLVDNTDQTTNNGIIFADARPEPVFGNDEGVNNGGSTNADLDIDVPDADAYPGGFLLWNTRYSTRNVKRWESNHLVKIDGSSEVYEGRWINASGNNLDGSPKMGSDAQKALIVAAIAEVLVSNEDIRSDFIFYNLIAAPGYPEVIDEMVSLNIDRKETAFVIGDSPMTLKANSTDLMEWTSNANTAPGNGNIGLVSADPYLGVYYPGACLTTNVDGTEVTAPASHMILRQIGFNDNVSYPWFAPAGLQRGRINNASAIGYLDDEKEFVSISLNEGQRDVLYTNNVNAITVLPNQGIVVYGQKTRNPVASAMSRINVARLVNYIRWNADIIAKPFLFEPNDKLTRDNVLDSFNRFLTELVTLRGLTDFLVVCDTSNNTPARIDRNELWIDLYIVPTKAIEFIYIPIRIRNTGSI